MLGQVQHFLRSGLGRYFYIHITYFEVSYNHTYGVRGGVFGTNVLVSETFKYGVYFENVVRLQKKWRGAFLTAEVITCTPFCTS